MDLSGARKNAFQGDIKIFSLSLSHAKLTVTRTHCYRAMHSFIGDWSSLVTVFVFFEYSHWIWLLSVGGRVRGE